MEEKPHHGKDSILAKARASIGLLIESRAPEATVCPSEAARMIAASRQDSAPGLGRDFMPAVHATVDELLKEDTIRLTWKGKRLLRRKGPYRISRKPMD